LTWPRTPTIIAGVFGSLGLPEILFILVVALLVFGPRRLPEVGKTLGKAMREFRRATTDLKRSVEVEMSREPDREEGQQVQRPAGERPAE
jgi:TatA/E family protein of Tat protein translocase